jgi:hypothetical protein
VSATRVQRSHRRGARPAQSLKLLLGQHGPLAECAGGLHAKGFSTAGASPLTQGLMHQPFGPLPL